MSDNHNMEIRYEPGNWIETHGEELTFEDACGMVGELLVADKSTVSRAAYMVVRLERVEPGRDGRFLVVYAGDAGLPVSMKWRALTGALLLDLGLMLVILGALLQGR